ncbi:beta-1,3-glucan-binding protein-like [Ptychodera flava]|uniref:beta-1,3-glucan-binding protein-like n=1 Tax=Ptychodera flava TaxID=63121 RepID=UPI00396A8F05
MHALLVLACLTAVLAADPPIFEDNFDYFDLSVWQHEITAGGGGNWEFQYYTNNRTNSYTRDGILYIKPTLTSEKYGEAFLTSGRLELWGASPSDLCTGNADWGCDRTGNAMNILNPIQSARLRTVHSFNFKYGRIEVRAKMPSGDWLWPAIWLLPTRNSYGGWPASGEIDIIESRGNEQLEDLLGNSVGADEMGATMHWGPYYPHNGWRKTHATRHATTGTYASQFHTYAVEWSSKNIRFFVDGEEILFVDPGDNGFWEYGDFNTNLPFADNPWREGTKMAPFDEEFYIILNVAVGGTTGYFGDDLQNYPVNCPKPWSNNSPHAPKEFWDARDCWYPTWRPDEENGELAAMQVDYVRVWDLTE